MNQGEQWVIDRDASDHATTSQGAATVSAPAPAAVERAAAERASVERASVEREVRHSLREQIARLERECSRIVAETFPHISAAPAVPAVPSSAAPTLLGMADLERTRDHLAARVQELRMLAGARAEHERRARELLERMRLEPGRHRFVRLPVSDLGEGGCGVWEVRPRLGLIGMLAGWWQLKLSSGCPLPMGSRPRRGPDRRYSAARRACVADVRS